VIRNGWAIIRKFNISSTVIDISSTVIDVPRSARQGRSPEDFARVLGRPFALHDRDHRQWRVRQALAIRNQYRLASAPRVILAAAWRIWISSQ
jgi:hypothetical protein